MTERLYGGYPLEYWEGMASDGSVRGEMAKRIRELEASASVPAPEPAAEITIRDGDIKCMHWYTPLQLLPYGTKLYTAPPPVTNAWHDAILAECMRIECAYAEADPAGTVARLIDWHVKNAAAPVGVSVPEPDAKDDAEKTASRLIDAWCEAYGQIPWAKAVEIVSIIQRLPEEERQRLLALDDDK